MKRWIASWISAVVIAVALVPVVRAQSPDEEVAQFVIRVGQGGFRDARSDVGKLGGGQSLYGVRAWQRPFVLFFSVEYYTNSPGPTEPFEIEDMFGFGAHYIGAIAGSRRFSYFAGFSAGYLAVPAGRERQVGEFRAPHFGLESGARARVYRAFGFYVLAKYLHARKHVDGERVIDFDEGIILVGVDFTFRL